MQNDIKIEYPDQVNVLLTATQWARVAEPSIPVKLSDNVNFHITKDDTERFAVTKLTGIIYVKQIFASEHQYEAIHNITVSWNFTAKPSVLKSKVIHLMLKKPEEELICSNDMTDYTNNFCAKFKVTY